MEAHEYQKLALRTASNENAITHACFGIGGEAGEILDMVKKTMFYGKELDKTKLLLEVGDALWYFNLLISEIGSTWEEVFDMNIAKLSARYPNLKFDADKAINRNTDAEHEAVTATLTK